MPPRKRTSEKELLVQFLGRVHLWCQERTPREQTRAPTSKLRLRCVSPCSVLHWFNVVLCQKSTSIILEVVYFRDCSKPRTYETALGWLHPSCPVHRHSPTLRHETALSCKPSSRLFQALELRKTQESKPKILGTEEHHTEESQVQAQWGKTGLGLSKADPNQVLPPGSGGCSLVLLFRSPGPTSSSKLG